jgi:Cu(I)/Ag(I) efflux system membrane fusion protein
VSEPIEGRYRAEFELAMGSTWNIEIAARPPDRPMARAEGALTVGAPGLRLEGLEGPEGSGADSEAAGTERAAMPAPSHHEGHPAEFQLPVGRLQRVGVKTAPAESRTLTTSVRAVGRVIAEETTLEDVSLKVRGWVGEIFADAVGDPVERGATLFTVYSPELYAAQEEYLQALRSRDRARASTAPDRADYLVRAARNRLRLWDIADREIERLEARGEPAKHLPIRAPVSGYVVEKNLVAGSALQPGERLYRIAPLSKVWIEAEVYESELPLVRAGQTASVTLPYIPERSFEATVGYVYPTLDPKTRTARLRLEIPNPDLALRPDMYANVLVHAERGERLVVPQSAVLHAGERSYVFLALGEGRFRPQAVQIGLRSGEDVEILSGLAPGESIVTSGTFLIASESRLRAALELW